MVSASTAERMLTLQPWRSGRLSRPVGAGCQRWQCLPDTIKGETPNCTLWAAPQGLVTDKLNSVTQRPTWTAVKHKLGHRDDQVSVLLPRTLDAVQVQHYGSFLIHRGRQLKLSSDGARAGQGDGLRLATM